MRYLVLFIFLLLGACDNSPAKRSINKITEQAISPDGQFVAVVFSRDSGAVGCNRKHVSILPKDTTLTNSMTGNVFMTREVDVRVTWQGNDQLVIDYPDNTYIYQQTNKYYTGNILTAPRVIAVSSQGIKH